jgi:hypothetical protein
MTTIDMSDGRPKEPRRLRELAAWYRVFAEETGNPVIWEARLRTAAELEREAIRLEEGSVPRRRTASVPLRP